MRVTMTLSLPREASAVPRARQVLTTLLSLTAASDACRADLAVLISEACANAVRHADPESTVDISIVIDDETCLLEVGNRGRTPDSGRFAAGLPDPLTVGGRGLPLIAALADTAGFVAGEPDRVLLRMEKHLTDVRR